jgi:hypothetical protein
MLGLGDRALAQCGETGHLLTHAACPGQRGQGVRPHGVDQADVPGAPEGDDRVESHDATQRCLFQDESGRHGVLRTVRGVVRFHDVVEVDQAVPRGEDQQPVGP